MTHPPASRNYSEQQAGSLRAGDHLILPDGNRSAEVHRVDVETDDFGTPAIVLATLSGGGVLRIAAGSAVRLAEDDDSGSVIPGTDALGTDAPRTDAPGDGTPTSDATGTDVPEPAESGTADAAPQHGMPAASDGATSATPASDGVTSADAASDADPSAPASGGFSAQAGEPGAPAAHGVVVPPQPAAPPAVSGPSEADLALIPTPDGTPESVVEAVATAHPGAVGVLLLSERLAKGINTKSGSCLKDLSDLAHELFVILKDAEHALAVADLLNVLPFDGNPGRWASVEASLALSSYICRQLGQDERAAVYEKFLRAPEAMETDPFKARMNAKVRQRSLNEPNLYDKEIFRSIDSANPDAEREWRLLRLEALLFLRAHGGSETIGAAELERRIGNELESVRA
ncbi:DUF6707 family protein [Arthrobacter sp. ov118]|jgi:hypothetical protein|uniref:DUF6707 family protein n=1 Tax=Arthrobacter sp. ov118 TaxID=1761747 RepID=UPI0008DF0B19|nr:DUF6707 family protein [Arthrobacter sp. ov118]SFT77400.1 hypothetical protein SAMN04487915_103166 [Arthrobacter sp. ov118]